MTAPSAYRRPLRLGMIGGGEGAYIGNIHRTSARQDGAFLLVAGAFDVDAGRGHRFAATQGIDPARSYGDYKLMIAGEDFGLWLSAKILSLDPDREMILVERLEL